MRLVDRVLSMPTRGTLSILIFHRVLRQADLLLPDLPDSATFERLVALLVARCAVLPLDEAISRFKRGELPGSAVAITFDDGYADNHDVAMPILKRHGISATFFIATGYIDGGIMWNDRIIESIRHTKVGQLDLRALELGTLAVNTLDERRAAVTTLLPRLKHLPGDARSAAVDRIVENTRTGRLPLDLMLSSAQVVQMAADGMEIGAHTVSHPILASEQVSAARREICASRDHLADLLRIPIRTFAYPNGRPGVDYLAAHVKIVRDAGFDAAVTTSNGVARTGDDVFQLPRFTPWDRPGNRFMLRLLQNRLHRPAFV